MDAVNTAINEIIDKDRAFNNPFTSLIFWGPNCRYCLDIKGFDAEHNVGVAEYEHTGHRRAFRLNGQRVYRRGRARFELGVTLYEIDTIVEDGAIWAGLGEKAIRAFVCDD